MRRPAAQHTRGNISGAPEMASPDGEVSFRFSFSAGGVHLERTLNRPGGARLVLSMRFADETAFIRWCETDQLKFMYPLLYSNLKRSVCALFRSR